MALRRVFVIWKHPIFHDSVRLLLKHPEVEIVGSTTDYTTVPAELSDLRPDTILIEEIEVMEPKGMSHILQAMGWDSRILTFNLNDNKLKVFHREQIDVRHYDDLLHLVLDELP